MCKESTCKLNCQNNNIKLNQKDNINVDSMLSSQTSDDYQIELEDEKKDDILDKNLHSISSENISSELSSNSFQSNQMHACNSSQEYNVEVKALGYITNMAEYMVASDIIVSKAGPGTIAEAAAVGLPVLLTSFLPGQEEGNVEFVVDNKFGEYEDHSNPKAIAEKVSAWFRDPKIMEQMSVKAQKAGIPNAAEDIAKAIGCSVVRWKELNEEDKPTANTSNLQNND